MKHIFYIFLLCFIFSADNLAFASNSKGNIIQTDSVRPYRNIIEARDTARIQELPDEYKAIKRATSQRKWTQKAFDIIIREPNPPKDAKHSISEEYQEYEGRIIRNITYKRLKPFGTSVINPDSSRSRYKTINNLHASTKSSVIRQMLQFKRGDYLKSIMLSESETILRDADYISDARINIIPLEHTTDSVDIEVITRDKWTIGVELHRLTSKRTDIELYNENLFGYGNRGSASFIYSSRYSGKVRYGGDYMFRNIAKTQIDAGAAFLDRVDTRRMSFVLERKLRPNLNYFGKASYDQENYRDEYYNWDSISPNYTQNFTISLGRAFTLPSHNTIKRFVVSAMFQQKHPEYRNPEHVAHLADRMLPYQGIQNKIWLGQLTLYENSYLRDYMIHNFGVTEDVAQGYNISLQGGYSKYMTPGIPDATYGSLKVSYGSHRLIQGYLFSEFTLSSFFSKKKTYESLIDYKLRYYSRLVKLPFGRFRQLVTFRYTKLLSPERYFYNRIHLGDYVYSRTRDYSKTRGGVEQIWLRLENNLFSNYSVAGFRFMFYNFMDFGYHTPDNDLFNSKNMFLGAGIGIRIRNDLLVFRSIDLKFGYYPKLGPYDQNKAYDISTSTPKVSPRFTPEYPEVILMK